jgi:hypothetical protein
MTTVDGIFAAGQGVHLVGAWLCVRVRVRVRACVRVCVSVRVGVA